MGLMWTATIIILALLIVGGGAVSATLMKRDTTFVPESHLSAWANLTTIVGGVAAAVSLLWAAHTYYESALLQRELSAASIYQESMQLSIAQAELANQEAATTIIQKQKDYKARNQPVPEVDRTEFEKYRWYVGHGLYSLEMIFQALPEDPSWKEAARGFMCSHRAYLNSDWFDRGRYSDAVITLVDEVKDIPFEETCPPEPKKTPL
jgi:hypothetical protein